MDCQEIKKKYNEYADKIQDKRYNSPYSLRRYSHRQNYLTILKYIKLGDKILEVGCGEGILSVMVAKKGAEVVATDISMANLEAAQKLAEKEGVKNIKFLLADAENLPFDDNSFDLVIADNVLEHLPDFGKGLSEIKRITKNKAVIALPTCINPCAWCLLGGDVYWKITRRTPYAIFLGFFRILLGIVLNNKGVEEGYGYKKELPHLWRYPWTMKKDIEGAGFKIDFFEATSICLPYFNFLLPAIKFLDRYKNKSILRNFGFSSIAVVEKMHKN